MATESLEFGPVVDLANEYLERHRCGERPTVDEYVVEHPEFEAQIREVFPMMLLMEDHAPAATETGMRSDTETNAPPLERLGDFRILREVGRGGMGIVYEAVQESLGRHVALKVFPTQSHLSPRHQERFRREARSAGMLHHTNIVPVFAVGEEEGMLYYAMQFIRGAGLHEVIDELSRLRPGGRQTAGRTASSRRTNAASQVAHSLLANPAPRDVESEGKTLRPSDDADRPIETSGAIRRFSESVPSTGSTQRAEIPDSSPRWRESSVSSAVHLPGQSADSSFTETGNQYWKSVARIGVQVAKALAYAHGQGTLHRDVKPSNLLLDENAMVWVADFGLAKSFEQDDLTNTGELIGTLRYMPPEQFNGEADARSDLYSLGLTLYELLTLRPAFDMADRHQLIRAITDADPPRPRKLNPRIPRDLETIVLKTIEREPASRYQTASDLARDLTRFLNNEPIQARPISTSERVVKWAKRRPAVAGLTAALVVVLFSALGAVTWKWQEERQAKVSEATQRQRAETLLDDSETHLYYSHIAQADLHVRLNNLRKAEVSLKLAEPRSGQRDRRGWEWRYLRGLLHTELMTLSAGTNDAPWVHAIAFSADGRYFATGASAPHGFQHTLEGVRGAAKVWDARTGELVLDLSRRTGSVVVVALNSDGTQLATSEFDVKTRRAVAIRVWDVASGTEIWSDSARPHYPPQCLQFSPDGEMLAGRIAYTVCVWEAKTGKKKFSAVAPQRAVGLEFSDDSRQLTALVGGSKPLQAEVVFDTGRGERLKTGRQTAPGRRDPTGTYSASIERGRIVKVRSAATGALLHEFRHEGRVWTFAFRPDGRFLATSGGDGLVRLWDLENGTPGHVFRGHANHVHTLAFSPTGDQLVSGGWNGVVKVWDVTRPPNHTSVFPYSLARVLTDVVFSADGERLTAAYQNVNRSCFLSTWNVLAASALRGSPPLDLNTRLVAPGRHTAFDDAGTRLAGRAQSDPKLVKVFDVRNHQEQQVLSGHSLAVHHVTISADGRRVASAANPVPNTKDGAAELKVWDTSSGKVLFELAENGIRFDVLALSPGGKTLAVARELAAKTGNTAKVHLELWDIAGKRRLHRLPLADPATAFEFDRSGRHLATADGESVKLWEVSTGKLKHSAEISDRIDDLAFNPAGDRLAGATRSRTTVWDTATGHTVITLRGPPRSSDPAFSPRVVFSRDGHRLAATQWDATVRVWSEKELTSQARAARLQAAEFRSRRWKRDSAKVPARLRGWWLAAHETVNRQVDKEPGNAFAIRQRIAVNRKLGKHDDVPADFARLRALGKVEDGPLWLRGLGDHVVARHIPFDTYEAFTVEAWVKNWGPAVAGGKGIVIYQGSVSETGVQFYATHGAFYAADPKTRNFRLETASGFRFGENAADKKWTHLAVVYDGSRQLAFCNGKLTDSHEVPNLGRLNPARRFRIGDTPVDLPRLRGSGLVGAVRISKTARYDKAFTPMRRLSADADTVLLFDFWRGEGRPKGTHIPDLSGRGNHGKLVGAWWK